MSLTDFVILQFSTTPWFVPHDPRWSKFLRLLHLRWVNRYSFFIRLMSHSPFSHVDFVLPDGNLLGASNQGADSPCIKGNPCGVAIRPAGYQNFGYRRRMVIKTARAGAIYAAAYSQLGKGFDNGGLKNFLSAKFPGTRDWRDPEIWWCSELAAWSVETGDYWGRQLSWPKNRCSPTDLLLLFAADANFVNHSTFWDPIPGLALEPWET